MENQNDPLGILELTKELQALKSLIHELTANQNPYADLVHESEFSERIKVSASTLRMWRRNGTVKDCWVKKGKHIWWSPRMFREEIQANP